MAVETRVLEPGQPGYSFNAETPANGTAGGAFALQFGDLKGSDRNISVQFIYDVAPAAVVMSLEGAMRDVDAEYKELARSTNVAGEFIPIADVAVRFLRAKKISGLAGGEKVTAIIIA